MKPTLVNRFDKWLQAYPDGIDNGRTPDANLPHPMPEDAQAQAALQHREEEQRREEGKLTSEEAARWRRQREEQNELTERVRKDAIAAASQATNAPQRSATVEYGYSRPQYGSANTIVVSDRSRHQQQEEEMRNREEEITRRRAEAKRLQEQEAIAQRQHGAENAARAVRQGLSLGGQAAFPQQTAPSSSVYQEEMQYTEAKWRRKWRQEQEAIAQRQHEAENAARAARQGLSPGRQAAFPQQTAPPSSIYQQPPPHLYQQAPPPSRPGDNSVGHGRVRLPSWSREEDWRRQEEETLDRLVTAQMSFDERQRKKYLERKEEKLRTEAEGGVYGTDDTDEEEEEEEKEEKEERKRQKEEETGKREDNSKRKQTEDTRLRFQDWNSSGSYCSTTKFLSFLKSSDLHSCRFLRPNLLRRPIDDQALICCSTAARATLR